MLTPILRLARRCLRTAEPKPGRYADCVPAWSEAMAERQAAIWWRVKPFTMTSMERVVALCQSIAYLEKEGIPGAIVECGVWRGGSVMAAALALLALQSTQREIYLYDTFAGMTEPDACDIDWQGRAAHAILGQTSAEAELVRAACPLHEVKEALMRTRYPWEKFRFVPGPVERTIPAHIPDQIALLRLDTDWHQSTAHELTHLYPRLSAGGVLIVDDYGHWRGARKAVDDYFCWHGIADPLRTIDFTARLSIKGAAPTPALAA